MSAFSIDTFPEALEAARLIAADVDDAQVCTCEDTPHQNLMHDLAHDLAANYPRMVEALLADLRALHHPVEVGRSVVICSCCKVRVPCETVREMDRLTEEAGNGA